MNGGQTTVYCCDGDQIICDYDGSGKLLRKFLYGTGIDETIPMSNVLPSADTVKDGLVEFRDYVSPARIWLLDINDAGFDPNDDLAADNVIDLQDVGTIADS